MTERSRHIRRQLFLMGECFLQALLVPLVFMPFMQWWRFTQGSNLTWSEHFAWLYITAWRFDLTGKEVVFTVRLQSGERREFTVAEVLAYPDFTAAFDRVLEGYWAMNIVSIVLGVALMVLAWSAYWAVKYRIALGKRPSPLVRSSILRHLGDAPPGSLPEWTRGARGWHMDKRREIGGELRRYAFAGIPWFRDEERYGAVVAGADGSGRTEVLADHVRQAVHRGYPVVVAGNAAAFIPRLYRKGRDTILDPADARCPAWSLFDDIASGDDLRAFAGALIPEDVDRKDADRLARTIFIEEAMGMADAGDRDAAALADRLLGIDAGGLAELVRADGAGEENAEALAFETAVVLRRRLDDLRRCQPAGRGRRAPFSIGEWVNANGRPGILFLGDGGTGGEAAGTLPAALLELAIRARMAEFDGTGRTVWVVADDIGALGRVPSLVDALDVSRATGLLFALGVSNVAELGRAYGGTAGAGEIISNCGTRLSLGLDGLHHTADWMGHYMGVDAATLRVTGTGTGVLRMPGVHSAALVRIDTSRWRRRRAAAPAFVPPDAGTLDVDTRTATPKRRRRFPDIAGSGTLGRIKAPVPLRGAGPGTTLPEPGGSALVVGDVGRERTACLRSMLDRIESEGGKGVVLDPDGSLASGRFVAGRDRILNPFDARGADWSPVGEAKDRRGMAALAEALVPDMEVHGAGVDRYWAGVARTLLAAGMAEMRQEGECDPASLVTGILDRDTREIAAASVGMEGGGDLLGDSGVRDDLRSVLAPLLQPLRLLRPTAEPFSIRNWVRDGDEGGFLFFSWRSDIHGVSRPLAAGWVERALAELVADGESGGRPVTLVVDGLDRLPRVPVLARQGNQAGGNAEGGKPWPGGGVVLAMADIAPIRAAYGREAAAALAADRDSVLRLGTTDTATADWIAGHPGTVDHVAGHAAVDTGPAHDSSLFEYAVVVDSLTRAAHGIDNPPLPERAADLDPSILRRLDVARPAIDRVMERRIEAIRAMPKAEPMNGTGREAKRENGHDTGHGPDGGE